MKFIFLAALLFISLLCAADAPTPPKTAEEILSVVRQSYAQQNQKQKGELRDDASGRIEPLELTMGNQLMSFLFTNPPIETIRLDLSTSPATLNLVRNGKSRQVPSSLLSNKVRGMDLNYEDLSLGFLYWPHPQLLKEERVNLQKCWLVRVLNPGKDGPYNAVDIWVHQASASAVKMEAYDRSSKLIKRYAVTKVQKVNGSNTLKELRVESLDTTTGKAQGRTYMKMNTPANP